MEVARIGYILGNDIAFEALKQSIELCADRSSVRPAAVVVARLVGVEASLAREPSTAFKGQQEAKPRDLALEPEVGES